MPSPRTIGIGFRLACADQEKMVCRFVRETISSAVMAPVASIVVMGVLLHRGFYDGTDAEHGSEWVVAGFVPAGRAQIPSRPGSCERRTGAHSPFSAAWKRADKLRPRARL